MSATRLVIDCETADASPQDVAAAAECYRVPGNIKDPAKREARKGEATARLVERAALLDSSPIISLAAKTETQSVLFNGMDSTYYPVEGWVVLPCGDERTMLWAFGQWAQGACDEHTRVIGHNLMRFDLPKLRGRTLWHRLPLPSILDPEQSAYDTMRAFKWYSMENHDELFISLDTVCASLGLPRKKPLLNGSDIPKLYREARYSEICTYNCLDAALTEAAYLLMQGGG